MHRGSGGKWKEKKERKKTEEKLRVEKESETREC
jgi:hypothetical protein